MNHFVSGVGDGPVDFYCVAECPVEPVIKHKGNPHTPWEYGTEQMIRKAFTEVRSQFNKFKKYNGRYTYAVKCTFVSPAKPKKVHWECCNTLFKNELVTYTYKEGPIYILALGATVVRALNIKFGKYKEIQGKLLTSTINGRTVYVLPTLSTRQLPVKSGYYEILKTHIKTFFKTIHRSKNNITVNTITPTQELIKDYIIPKTIKEVQELVEYIVAYEVKGDPHNHPISLDTEVNTLYPHRKKTKILTLTAAWDAGKATSIPIEHLESPWSFEEILPYILPLLQCKKPKIFHNAKYDLKVLFSKGLHVERFSWDTMLGEHLLAEDKRGYYDLKRLTTDMLPRYAGYEDDLKQLIKQLENKGKLLEGHADVKLTKAEKKLEEDVGYEYVPLNILNPYGAIDADVTRQICGIQRHNMQLESNNLSRLRNSYRNSPWFGGLAENPSNLKNPLVDLMYHRSVPVTKTLATMEFNGFPVDREYLHTLRNNINASVTQLHSELTQMVPSYVLNEEFNPNSPGHLRRVLFQTGYINPDTKEPISYQGRIPEEEIPRTATNLISTNAAFLKLLKNKYDCVFATTLLDYKALFKAMHTYIDNINIMSAEDGRMHTTFHISGTATGRLSSSNENMQNIPATILKHNIKKLFTTEDPSNMVVIDADAKAAEVRIYAAYSKDKNLINALNDGMDPHSYFASTVYNPATVLQDVPKKEQKNTLTTVGIDDQHEWSYADFQNREELAKEDPDYSNRLEKLRKNIKRVVFGILYGAGKRNIANIVGIPVEQAQAIINVLFKMFPSIPDYIRKTELQVEYLNVVETLLGRRRRFDYNNLDNYLKSKAKRQAVNFKIQSTSSDLVLDVLNSTLDPIKNDFGGSMYITVHDSLVFGIPKKYVSQMPDFINEHGVKNLARKYSWLPVPMHWDICVGPSYGETKSVDQYLAKHPELVFKEDSDYFDQEEINYLKNAQSADFYGI